MYSHEYEWPSRYDKERSSSTSSCESFGKQTVVTALVEPLPEEKSKINRNNIKTKNFQTVPKRKQHIDLDKIEVCNPTNNHQIFKEQKQQINITRTLMQLNQNIDNEINKKQHGIYLDTIKSKLESKKDAFLTQESKAEEQDKQKRKIVNFDANTEGWSPCKKQRITKSPVEDIEDLSKSFKSPKLLAKETSSSESNEETERSGSEELRELLDELQDQHFLTELEKAFIESKEPTDISKENRTLYEGNKRETINCSVDSTKISSINSNLIETENISKSDLDKNETYSCTVIAECVITGNKK